MNLYVIYAVIILGANILGTIVGMGGGVIIKPLMDMIGAHPLIQINFFSSVAVLTMSATSTVRQSRHGMHIKKDFFLSLGIGSIIGGWIGDVSFNFLLSTFRNDALVNQLQIALTIFSLALALAYSVFPIWHRNYTNWKSLLFMAIFLGWLSTILGIGGGPINVALMMALCSFPIKDATVYSLVTILFSQSSKVLSVFLSGNAWNFDLKMLLMIIPISIIGGILGTICSHYFKASKVTIIYRLAVVMVICLNIYNGINYLS